MQTSATRATVDDLMRTEGRAELIGGRIVHLMATGSWPGEVAGNIYSSLREYARRTGQGKAHTDGVGCVVPMLPSGRESFMPDAAYYLQIPPRHWKFVLGAPVFAVEVRSENDFGPAAELELADKRADYFQAGTQIVWDVDPMVDTIVSYRANGSSVTFRRGDIADAEPAVPGWSIPVDEVFAS